MERQNHDEQKPDKSSEPQPDKAPSSTEFWFGQKTVTAWKRAPQELRRVPTSDRPDRAQSPPADFRWGWKQSALRIRERVAQWSRDDRRSGAYSRIPDRLPASPPAAVVHPEVRCIPGTQFLARVRREA